MATTAVETGQTWWDVGVRLSGAWEAGIDLALNHNLSMTLPPPQGLSLRSNKTYNLPMERYCHAEGVSPATLYEGKQGASSYQIFSPVFNTVYR